MVEDPLSCSCDALHDIPLDFALKGDCKLFFFRKNVIRSEILQNGDPYKSLCRKGCRKSPLRGR